MNVNNKRALAKLWLENDSRLDEPCVKCGKPTVSGTTLLITRLMGPIGWICGECERGDKTDE